MCESSIFPTSGAINREQGEGHDFLHEATQVKNIWVPTGE
jgi:hypothetical protein